MIYIKPFYMKSFPCTPVAFLGGGGVSELSLCRWLDY